MFFFGQIVNIKRAIRTIVAIDIFLYENKFNY